VYELSAINFAKILKLVFEISSLQQLTAHRHTDTTGRLSADNKHLCYEPTNSTHKSRVLHLINHPTLFYPTPCFIKTTPLIFYYNFANTVDNFYLFKYHGKGHKRLYAGKSKINTVKHYNETYNKNEKL